jgi:hypothetical protein
MRPVPIGFRVISYFMAGLLAVCVVLQFNDPDPLRWIAIYGAGTAISFALPSTRRVALVALLVGLGTAVWALLLLADVWGKVGLSDFVGRMSEKGGAVEVQREAGGLGIQALWLLLGAAYRARRA